MSTQEARAFASENGLLFTETSALSDSNVTEAFASVGKKILNKLETNVIDPSIEEYGVKKPGREIADLKEYDQLVTKQRKKKKKCAC